MKSFFQFVCFLFPTIFLGQGIVSSNSDIIFIVSGTVVSSNAGLELSGNGTNYYSIPQGTTLNNVAPYSKRVLMSNSNAIYEIRNVANLFLADFFTDVNYASQVNVADLSVLNANTSATYQLNVEQIAHPGYNDIPVEWTLGRSGPSAVDMHDLVFKWGNALEPNQILSKALYIFDVALNNWIQLPTNNTNVDNINNIITYSGYQGALTGTRFMIAEAVYALPVELLSFSGNCESGTVTLNWQTATEHNSDYFTLEKSRDGQNWQLLTSMDAAGNSTQLLNYETTDENAMEGNNYYRLSQVDYDGTTKEYNVINVSCIGGSRESFIVYPNPSSSAFQVVLEDKHLVGNATLMVKDTKCAMLLNRSIEVKPGINLFNVGDMNLAPGVYYIQVVNGERATEVLKEVIR